MASHAKQNAIILFRPEAYTVGEQVKGRQAAGASFLKGFVNAADVDRYFVTAPSVDEARHFAASIGAIKGSEPEAVFIPYSAINKAEEIGLIYQPDPLLAELAWWRRRFDQRLFSLCGVAHTTATQAVMRGLPELVTGPLQPWDAVICPSRAVKSMITRLVGSYADYLSDRFGRKVSCPVEMPVIPLGVNADEFEPTSTRVKNGKALRRQLGIGDKDVVALFMGRLDPTKKIDPELTYRTLERACQQTDKKLHMIWCGWFADQNDQRAFVSGAERLRGKVDVHFVDGQKPTIRENIWHAADVFLGLVENIQETFGIAPIEAMAAGLPAIVTDWDGFKETVEDGVQGYSIKTLMLPPGTGERIAWRFESFQIDYSQYLSAVSQTIHVDIRQAADALVRLAEDADLRKQMGQAGIARVQDHFEWSKIIPQYQALWTSLAEIRGSAAEIAAGKEVPRGLDPFDLFAGYPSGTIDPSTKLADPDFGGTSWPQGLGMGPPKDVGKTRTAKGVAGKIADNPEIGWLWAGKALRAKDELD